MTRPTPARSLGLVLPRAPACGLALLLLAVPLVLPVAGAQADQQPAAPGDFANGQVNGLGRIAMEPYVEANGAPVLLAARITLLDRATLERASSLLVAINLEAKDVEVGGQRLAAGDRVFTPTRTDVAEGGKQFQSFYDPAEILASSAGGQVDLVLTATATAKANGQWHVGALVIAFDAGWGTLRSSDGGAAVLYGFSLVMEDGLAGSALAPFHGQGNAGILLLPAVVALAGAAGGAWQLAAICRAKVAQARLRQAKGPGPAGAGAGVRTAGASGASRRLPIQGPRLPAGLAPAPWRPTPMPGDRPAVTPAVAAKPATSPKPAAPSVTAVHARATAPTRPGRRTGGAPRPARRPSDAATSGKARTGVPGQASR